MTESINRCICDALQVNIDIDSESGRIRLRGSVEKMEEAKVLLEAFNEANYGIEMDLLPDDQATLQSVSCPSILLVVSPILRGCSLQFLGAISLHHFCCVPGR